MVKIDDYPLVVAIKDQRIQTRLASVNETVNLSIENVDLRILVGVLNGVISLEDALNSEAITLRNPANHEKLQQFTQLFVITIEH